MKSPLLIPSLIATAFLAGGCASSNSSRAKSYEKNNEQLTRSYEPVGAAALAFDPPIASAQPLPTFDRTGRAAEAFAGYEDQVTVFSYTHQRDEIRVSGDYGRLDRRAYTDRTSVIRR
jgi:PBP1b-binding outer membrane lipoprotein LpoB